MFRWTAACMFAIVAGGCALTPEEFPADQTFDRRGVPVSWDSVPDKVRDSFRAKYPAVANPPVEKCNNGSNYRFELPTGEALFLDSNGNYSGGVI
ncbi:MAG TPA: hypothetical protein VMP01_12145 [Pirellulaceae bacterium]|nr:hypothetical protein [Pirellulaceae bacterium]